jgi:hypothetical protein
MRAASVRPAAFRGFAMGIFDSLDRACMRTFGEPVTYRPSGGPDHAMSGIFDEAHEMIAQTSDGAEESVVMPALSIRAADLPEGIQVEQSDRFVIRGRTYSVWDVQPQGEGWTLLPLKVISR